MRTTVFPTLEEALYLHQALLERFGGSTGIRDLGLIESALARPRSGYYETLPAQAAALMQSFANNHGFVDGNKRMGFTICAVFLNLNGYNLRVEANEAELFLVESVIKARAHVSEIAVWIEKHLEEL